MSGPARALTSSRFGDTRPERSRAGRTAAPRLGFLGLGWIGRRRLRAIADSGCAAITALADPDDEARAAAREIAADARCMDSLEAMLDSGLVDGVVIASPSALHASQAIRALEAGSAVYCQKPLGRTAAETRRVIDAARSADRLLDVDFCYRHTEAARALKQRIDSGELGEVFATDLTFHNAYGPDGSWYYRPELSGGGCLMDLGIHLVDLAFWLLGDSRPSRISAHLFSAGERVSPRRVDGAGGSVAAGRSRERSAPDGAGSPGSGPVEDYAVAELTLAGGRLARISCSWRLAAGRDAVIEIAVYGTRGGVLLRNLDGSFFDFIAERLDRRSRTRLSGPPDDWEPRGIVGWARRLASGGGYDPAVEHVESVARTLDAIYESCTSC